MLCKRGLCRHAVSVRPYVCPSVTFVDSVERNKRIFKIFSPSDRPFQFFRTKRHGNIPTRTILTGASNAGRVDRNRDSEPISGSIACCQRCDRLGVITRRRRTVASWHLLLVVSGSVCWWRETTTNKKSQRYAKDNRTAFNCTQW